MAIRPRWGLAHGQMEGDGSTFQVAGTAGAEAWQWMAVGIWPEQVEDVLVSRGRRVAEGSDTRPTASSAHHTEETHSGPLLAVDGHPQEAHRPARVPKQGAVTTPAHLSPGHRTPVPCVSSSPAPSLQPQL